VPEEGDSGSEEEATALEVRAFIADQANHGPLLGRIRKRVNTHHVEDVLQETLMRASTARHRASSAAMLPGWIGGIADHAIADFYRKRASLLRQDQVVADAAESRLPPITNVNEGALLVAWLTRAVEKDPYDAETLDMIKDHVWNGKTYGAIAAERGMTERVVQNRVGYFKVRFIPLREERRRRLSFMIILFAGVIAGAIYVISRMMTPPPAPRVEPLPAPTPVTTASVFEPAEKVPAPPPIEDRKTK
jgi:DNA-directed RNA polymerase specialized sigma24 family protein